MPRVRAEEYPEDSFRRMHLSNLALLLDGEYDGDEESYFALAGFASHEWFEERGIDYV